MSHYDVTKARIYQWVGIILIMAVFSGAYWYFKVYGSTLNQSQNDLNTNGLVGMWSFNGDDISGTTAYDRSGSGNNGTLTNGPGKADGKIGQSLDFDGTNDYVSLTDGTQFDPGGTASWCLWFYNDTALASSTALFMHDAPSSRSASTYKWIAAYLTTNSSNLSTYVRIGGTAYNAVGPALATGYYTNAWHHVCSTFDKSLASARLKIYIDGTLSGTADAANGDIDAGGFPEIGRWEQAFSYFNGKIDEVRMYNRAITASEVESLYTQGGGTKVNTAVSQPQGTGRLDSGLAGYWPLDNGSGTSATDASTNGNTGTLTNSPTWTTGQIGGAVDFDGTDDVITTSTVVPNMGTVSAWVNTTAVLNSGDYYYFVGGAVAGNSMSLRFNSYSGFNRWDFNMRGNFGTDVYVSGPTLTTDTQQGWHHLTAVWDTSKGASLYLDGALLNSTTTTTSAFASMALSIGNPSSATWLGKIDEVRMYSRMLSADEVSQLYRLTMPTSVDTSLKGYWSFNAPDMTSTTAYDRSGAGNTGTLTNGPVSTEGKLGQGLSFDGTDDYVSVADTAAFTESALTVSFWKKNTNVASNSKYVTKSATNQRSWSVESSDAGRNIRFIVSNSSSSESEYGDTPTGSMTAGEWYFVTCVFDGSGLTNAERVQIYINGVAQSVAFTGTIPASLVNNTQAVTLGGKASAAGFLGSLDEARIYNRALTVAEIKGLYDVGQSDWVNSSASQPQGTGRLDSGLAGYWKMDDGSGTSATDGSTNSYTGTLTSGPTWTTGQIGGAVSFDGVDDYIDTDNSTGLDTLFELSYSVWVYPTASDGFILGKRTNGGGTEGFRLTSGTLQGWVANYSGASSGRATSTTAVSLNTWSLVTMTYSKAGDNKPHLYINGTEVAYSEQDTLLGSDPDDQYDFFIGRIQSNPELSDVPYTGKIDEVRIYNRALSADEVRQLYRLTTPTGTDTGLKGYWSFNGKDTSSTTAFDSSGAGNNGTLTNGPAVIEGKSGQGIDFFPNGSDTNAYVTMGDPASGVLDFGTGDFSVGFWMKGRGYNNQGSSTNVALAKKAIDFGSTAGYAFSYVSTNLMAFNIGDGTTGYTITAPVATTADNTWHHYEGVRSGSTMYFYIDGVVAGSTRVSGSVSNGTSFAVGYDGVTTRNANAIIDEVRVYNRALTESEIKSLYNSSR